MTDKLDVCCEASQRLALREYEALGIPPLYSQDGTLLISPTLARQLGLLDRPKHEEAA